MQTKIDYTAATGEVHTQTWIEIEEADVEWYTLVVEAEQATIAAMPEQYHPPEERFKPAA